MDAKNMLFRNLIISAPNNNNGKLPYEKIFSLEANTDGRFLKRNAPLGMPQLITPSSFAKGRVILGLIWFMNSK